MTFWQRVHDYFFPHERNNYRPHFFGLASLAVIVVALIALEGAYFTQIKVAFTNENFLASILPAVLADLTNQDRAANDAPALTENPVLDKAAALAAQDMASKGYFAHVSPSGTTPWDWLQQVGYNYTYAGENLAVNFDDTQALETAWMNSPTHKANIIKPQYTQIGFGIANGMYQGAETTFVVTFFATPAAAAPAPTSTPAPLVVAPIPAATPAPVPTTPTVAVAPAPTAVLGAQTQAAAPVAISWLDTLRASPATSMEWLLTILFGIFAALLAVAIVVKIRIQHASVILGGVMLLALVSGAMLLDSSLAGKPILPSDTQAASVEASGI